MAQLASVAELKEVLGITDSSKDTLLGNLLTRASAYVEWYTGRVFGRSVTVTDEIHDANSSLWLNNADIRSVTSLKLGLPGYQTTVDPSGYVTNIGGRIVLGFVNSFGSAWYGGSGYDNVYISYTYGTAAVPEEIKQATIDIATGLYKDSDASGSASNEQLASESLGDLSVSYNTSGGSQSRIAGDLPTVKNILEGYRLRRV